MIVVLVFFFKQKTAYELRISDWSSDVCSSDLITPEIAIAFSGGKNELGILGLLDFLDHSDRSGADRPHGLAGLGVSKTQAAMLEIDLLPPEARDLLAAASGPHPQAPDVERLSVAPVLLQLAPGFADRK